MDDGVPPRIPPLRPDRRVSSPIINERSIQALFVHGMARSPSSGWNMLWHLRRAGIKTDTFAYSVRSEDFDTIRMRLVTTIRSLANNGDYVLIGHSLGGVLLRAAVRDMPPDMRRPERLFPLGSPLRPARIGRRFYAHPVYRVLAGDCGQLLGAPTRVSNIGPAPVPVTSIAGVFGGGHFRGEPDDGVVTVSEVSAAWIDDQVVIRSPHVLLPSSARVARIILDRLTPARRAS